jgi:hypothetical protein
LTKSQKKISQETKDLGDVLSSVAGRRFIKRLLDGAQLDSTGFDRDPVVNAFNQGARHMGMALKRELKEDHWDHYLLMQRESRRDDEEQELQPQDPTVQDFS